MGMDDLFKQKLLTLRNPPKASTFADALMGETSWLKKSPSVIKAAKPIIPAKEAFSEKAQVLESLERFAQEKVEETGHSILKLDGGEIRVKAEPGWEGLQHFQDLTALKSALKLDSRVLDIILKNKTQDSVKAIFVSEKFRHWDELSAELKSGFIDELIVGFPLKTAELFERMIMAMKLDPSEVIIYPVEGTDESDYSHEVMEIASFFNPEVIITLGAKATQKILKSNDRLSMVHGQFFTRKAGNQSTFQIVPLFHPSIIETNQNMKKTAWADMQKIMKHLKKLP